MEQNSEQLLNNSKELLEQSKQLLEHMGLAIQAYVDMYNKINPDTKLEFNPFLLKKKVEGEFVCLYDYEKVGLFSLNRRFYESADAENRGMRYFDIYLSSGGHVGLTNNYRSGWNLHTERYQKGESDAGVLCNCMINYAIGFDDLRDILYKKGIIDKFEYGFASSDEIREVLKHSYEYFEELKKLEEESYKRK